MSHIEATTQTAAEIPAVSIAGYFVEVQTLTGVWRRCGEEYWKLITDVVDAETFLNQMRDTRPENVYRLVRQLVITEVVHA